MRKQWIPGHFSFQSRGLGTRLEVPRRLHYNVQLARRLLTAFSNRQLSQTMADLSLTRAYFYTMVPEIYTFG